MGDLHLAGTTVHTPGTLRLSADTLYQDVQQSQIDTQSTTQGRDLAWQKARDAGSSDQSTHYNELNAGQLVLDVNRVQAGLGARDSIEQLAQQPGMQWVQQLQNDPQLQGKVDWQRVEEAHERWDYKQQGLTPGGRGHRHRGGQLRDLRCSLGVGRECWRGCGRWYHRHRGWRRRHRRYR